MRWLQARSTLTNTFFTSPTPCRSDPLPAASATLVERHPAPARLCKGGRTYDRGMGLCDRLSDPHGTNLRRQEAGIYSAVGCPRRQHHGQDVGARSEEHTSELQSLMRISYAVFCLKKKKYAKIYYN